MEAIKLWLKQTALVYVMANVLLIKSEKANDPYLQALAEHNHKGYCIPALSFQFMNISELANKLKCAQHYAGIIFSSQNAVQACHNAQQSTDTDILSQWKNKSNYVVGESTKLTANELLSLECRGADSGNAAALANLIHSELKPEETSAFLYPKTSLKTIDLSEFLAKHKFKTDELEVYNTLADPNIAHHINSYYQLLGSSPDAVVFFSPSGVDCCLHHVTSIFGESIKLIAVGPSTSRRLKEKDVEEHFVLDKPNSESLIDCLRKQLAMQVT